MSRKKRVYDDDGRTIADMTGVSGPGLFTPRFGKDSQENRQPEQQPQRSHRPWEDTGFSRKERLMVVLGTLKATMLIALAYIVGFGLLILLMYLAI